MREIALIVLIASSPSEIAAAGNLSQCGRALKIIESVAPELSPKMHNFRGGRVVIEFTLGADGSISDVTIVESDIEKRHSEILHNNIKLTLSKWRFERQAVACKARIPMNFELTE